jgi:uncharacterized membrane protein
MMNRIKRAVRVSASVPLWLVPMIYVLGSIVCGIVLPRLEHHFFPTFTLGISVASAQAFLSAAASGMMALTGIVFSIAFVMVQFSAIAYSPRLVTWFAQDRTLFHSLGVFMATFVYCLASLAWIDREGTAAVALFSSILAAIMLVVSMLFFSRLVQRLSDLQITNVLQLIGQKGREVIGNMFPIKDEIMNPGAPKSKNFDGRECLGPELQKIDYSGEPRTIARFDMPYFVGAAQRIDGILVLGCAVGDTLVQDTLVLRVHGAKGTISDRELMQGLHLAKERTFEQDPKYPLRLLVDIAIKALSPAINDPTTAVQAIDQIEDLLRRLGKSNLDVGYALDANGQLRVLFPVPTWDDYLALAFDEIRQFGSGSVQVMRRLRSALLGVADSVTAPERIQAVHRYLRHLDDVIGHSGLDAEDRVLARQEDRQGLGLSRNSTQPSNAGLPDT